jgi:hypothetical protein
VAPKSNKTQNNYTEKPLLTSFLHELMIVKRQLALYPADHPSIQASVTRALELLEELFHSEKTITLGISPEALFFEQTWLDREDTSNKAFATFFSALGIASVSFHRGLKDAELIRFNQILRADRNTIESFGGFEEMLAQQHIDHISMIPVDYTAFQASQISHAEQQQLWEKFLHGLQNGLLEFGNDDSNLDLETVAEIFNQNVDSSALAQQCDHSISSFIEKRIHQKGFAHTYTEADRKFNSLLGQLQPEARQQMFKQIFQVLERHQSAAPGLLKKVPPQLLKEALAAKTHQQGLSSRLIALAGNLADEIDRNQHRTVVRGNKEDLSPEMVRARLDILFNEERQDLYMPDTYQLALGDILNREIDGTIPEEEKLKLKAQLESQVAEHNFAAILIEMLDDQLNSEQETAIQKNFINLSRYFLDTGDFSSLLNIYDSWARYLNSGKATVDIFDEKVLANQTQASFMAEVIDGFDSWEEEIFPQIVAYISKVGNPYSDLIIEQLGLAPTWEKRKHWIDILIGIGNDAKKRILHALDDERWYLVRNLLDVLNTQLDPGVIKKAQQLCSHPHPKVRMEATRILFSCNPATANRQLLRELCSDDPEARLSAIEIADSSHDHRVLEFLHKTLSREPKNELQLQEQIETARTLARIGNNESLPVMNRVIRRQRLIASRRTKTLQQEILRNLALFPGESAKKLLHEHCSGKFKQLAQQLLRQT